MIGVFNNVSIEGIASAVPSMVEKNHDAQFFLGERRCKKQIKLTGIQERRVSKEGQKVSDLFYVASKKLLKHFDWNPEEIKVLVVLTQRPDYKVPSTAFYMQKILNLPQDSIVFDVNIGCSGFNMGLHIVGSLLQQFPEGTKALCLQGDLAYQAIKNGISADSMANMMLFGSGVSAFVMQKKDKAQCIYYATYSYGDKYDAIIRCGEEDVQMDGPAVFEFSTNYVVEKIKKFKKNIDLNDENVDYYVFHQAQKLILDSIQSELDILDFKELRSIECYGNTSGASIPISICANQQQLLHKSIVHLFTCGFGVGLSCSMAYFPIVTENILPIIYTDYIHSEDIDK